MSGRSESPRSSPTPPRRRPRPRRSATSSSRSRRSWTSSDCALLKQATDEAAAERHRLLEAAGQAADALSVKRQETLRSEAQALGQALRRRTEQEVFAVARKALADLATTSLEERLGEVFTRHLREMRGQDKARFADALKTASTGACAHRLRPPREGARDDPERAQRDVLGATSMCGSRWRPTWSAGLSSQRMA